MKQCSKCGYSGQPRLEQAWLVPVTIVAWIIPLSFLSLGFWPFFLLPAIVITAWTAMAVRWRCPSCGQPWKKTVDNNRS